MVGHFLFILLLNSAGAQPPINNSTCELLPLPIILQEIQMTPHMSKGKRGVIDGYQVAMLQKNSRFHRLGLRKGDILKRVFINGKEKKFDTIALAMEAYLSVRKKTDKVIVHLLRQSKLIKLATNCALKRLPLRK